MRELPFHHEPQIAALVHAYRNQITDTGSGPEGSVGEYADKLASLTYDELLARLLVACPAASGCSAWLVWRRATGGPRPTGR